MRGTEGGSDLGSPTVEAERRSSARFADHFDFEPIHTTADPGSQRLRPRFLGRKARRKASAKLGTSTCTSRWVTMAFLCV